MAHVAGGSVGRHPHGRATLLLGLVALAAGPSSIIWASLLDPGPPKVLGGDLPINGSGTARLAVEAHNSPALVVNPTNRQNLAVASRVDSPRFGCALHVTFDGGTSWQRTPLTGPKDAAVACFAPDLAFGRDGTLYVAFTSLAPVQGRGTVPDALWVASSRDGGRTISVPTRAPGPSSPFQTRLAADPERAGRLYITWVEASGTSTWGFADVGNPIRVARSDDGGGSWMPPATISPPTRLRIVAPTIVVGSDHAVYVSYLDVGNDRLDYEGAHEGRGGQPDRGPWALVLARSPDLGGSWQETVVEDALVPAQRFLVLYPPTPSMAVDPRHAGRLYLAFHDGRLGDADVYVWGSDDGGRTWTTARRVVDTPRRDGRSQYLPALSIAPAGRLDIVYYDRRADAADTMNEVSLQSSYDRGRTFTPRVRLSSRSFDSHIGLGSEREMAQLGSRLGLVSTPRGALAVWADTRAGSALTGRQDLARTVVAFPGRSPLRAPLRVGGVAVGGLGLIAVAWALVSRRRHAPPPPS